MNFAAERAAVALGIEPHIIDGDLSQPQLIGEVARSGQHQNQLLLVVRDIGAFFGHFRHQHRVTPRVEIGQHGYVGRELVTEYDPQDVHGCFDRGAEARQRSEQYFTFSQSRAHFLRHANRRPQHAQRLVGKSSLRRILGMALPRHGLAAPVEEAAVPFQGEAIDNPE